MFIQWAWLGIDYIDNLVHQLNLIKVSQALLKLLKMYPLRSNPFPLKHLYQRKCFLEMALCIWEAYSGSAKTTVSTSPSISYIGLLK